MLNNKPAFWKALHSLTHPLSIAAILLLLFNDHWLRHNYPSWITGKLGDFTWLLFAPFIVAMLFAVLIPRKIEKHSKIVGLLSITFIGFWFATAKTVPVIHWLTTETLSAIVGYRGTLRMDVTDLLTLPALLISWHIWQTSSETKVNLKPVAYVAFGLAMLGTMASDNPTYNNSAIEQICEQEDGRLITTSYFSEMYYPTSDSFDPLTSYMSDNGGLSWRIVPTRETLEDEICSSSNEQFLVHPTNESVQYRWVQDDYVEQSLDAGETWNLIHDLPELNQDVREYGNQNPIADPYSTELGYMSSPVSGIVHSETGNLVLAMSRDGILVIAPDGESYWVAIEEFQLDNLQELELLSDALAAHKFLLPTLWFLILVTTIVIIQSRRLYTKFWLGLGWIHWTLLVIMSHKVFDYIDGYGEGVDRALFWGGSALFSLVFVATPLTIWAIASLPKYHRAFVPILVSAILASAGYLLPLILWTQGLIPRYYVASIFSILLTGCVLWACYVYFKDKLPARYENPKEKRKSKEA